MQRQPRLASVSSLLALPSASISCGSCVRQLHTTFPLCKGAPTSKKKQGADSSQEWSQTLLLPQTEFKLRANAAQRDHLFHQRTCTDLYQKQLARTSKADADSDFVFHDGPPYANGSLHCGHALNKILKDMTNRYQLLRGKRIHYNPGWDCHGLPIEMKALSHLRSNEVEALTPSAIRSRACSEAESAIEQQKSEFQRFGIMADWSGSSTYRTIDPAYEARQLKVFGEMVKKGLIYRQYRPVYWSPSNRTALAEAELEYKEDHQSKAVYVEFDLIPGPSLGSRLVPSEGVKLVVWTTTPWTLPSNAAVNVNPEMEYSIVQRRENGRKMLIATERIEAISKLPSSSSEGEVGQLEELLRIQGSALFDSTYRTPLMSSEATPRNILPASYVTAGSGTGLVHSAPAHGAEDYDVWKSQGLLEQRGIFSPVDDRGCYTSDIKQLDEPARNEADSTLSERLVGKDVLGAGAEEVIQILREKNALLSLSTLRHKYPYDWRSKLPVIVRATSQWFANLDRIKDSAIKALEKVTFVPESSRVRLESFIRGRSEWCISRQRVWGVPIPVVYNAATDEALLTTENIEHIASLLESKGTDYWWEGEAEEFVALQYRNGDTKWRKGQDTMDVWFDSGTSWATVRDSLPADVQAARRGGSVADVYLEGSDQHRGWFQSSLLTAVATTPEGQEPVAPYKTVVTHGYVLDKDSRKMSKSLGNTISPLIIVNGGEAVDQVAYGTDVLRLWTASSDYTTDSPIGSLIINKTSKLMRKLRNTARFMLANMPEEEAVAPLDKGRMSIVDQFVMHELFVLERSCTQAYEAYDFAQVVRRITEFTNVTLSALYLDLAKDCLYLDVKNGDERTSMVSVIDQILKTFTSILAPITPFLAEDVHHYRSGAKSDPVPGSESGITSVFSRGWQTVDGCWQNDTLGGHVGQLLAVRDTALSLIEEGRQANRVKTSFEVEVDIILPSTDDFNVPEVCDLIRRHANELTRLFNVARVNVLDEASTPPPAQGTLAHQTPWSVKAVHAGSGGKEKGVLVRVQTSRRSKCPRCRTFRKENEGDRLCLRCEKVVGRLARPEDKSKVSHMR